MFVLIIGGSASGKSEYAEQLCVQLAGEKRKLYIATMEPYGEEANYRIQRHHKLRKSKGFDTLEQYRNLWEITEQTVHTILLECMSTLLANELFGETNPQMTALASIMKGVAHLQEGSEHFVVVSNKVFNDGVEYSKETMDYIRAMGELNCALAREADVVIEVVCGIPVIHKGQEYWNE